MNAAATSADDGALLPLTLPDVDEAARRAQRKERVAVDATITSFHTFTTPDTVSESTEALSMPPLTLPASPTLLPLTSSPSLSAPASSETRVPMYRYIALDRPSACVQDPYFQSDASPRSEFHGEMPPVTDEYRRLTDAMNLPSVATSSSARTGHHAIVPPSQVVDGLSSVDASLATTSKRTKRKHGTKNGSVDLQTKIRIIEVAEQYRYDPKSSSRQRHERSSFAGPLGRELVNGIRLAAHFGLNKSTVSRILKRKEEFKKAYYKDKISGCSKHINKKSKFEKLNRLVENWFDMHREKNGTITDTVIRDVGKRYAEELGIEDFRGSNGWVRSLRNRKAHTGRSNGTLEEQEAEQRKRDKEAIERMRAMFPTGVKDLVAFFTDLSTYLEKSRVESSGVGNVRDATSSHRSGNARETGTVLISASYPDGHSHPQDEDEDDNDDDAEELLKKKMVESLRLWSQELLALELAKIKRRMTPRQAAML
ncbi:hypothetical protein PsorP6_006698 [Peronosclerospora sorghi]|uniref:Uncharacterized protein n=1 Tax=Peronosclerospora sorghi TaxID=230839 RepID=A0ACC0W0P8_9STRA|nr:hypothetical protein PsorP6_006698 [Peronosclerospora sorghi]